jgi:hypothetical protein
MLYETGVFQLGLRVASLQWWLAQQPLDGAVTDSVCRDALACVLRLLTSAWPAREDMPGGLKVQPVLSVCDIFIHFGGLGCTFVHDNQQVVDTPVDEWPIPVHTRYDLFRRVFDFCIFMRAWPGDRVSTENYRRWRATLVRIRGPMAGMNNDPLIDRVLERISGCRSIGVGMVVVGDTDIDRTYGCAIDTALGVFMTDNDVDRLVDGFMMIVKA